MNAARAIASRAPAPPRRAPAPPVHDAAEQQAERAGRAVAGAAPFTSWSFAAVPVAPPPEVRPGDPHALEALAGVGKPLDAPTQEAMEARFGVDLSDVRLHDDVQATESTRAAGTEGLAVGTEIALGRRHDPASAESRALLAHEVTHVLQQRVAGATEVVQRKNGGAAAPATTLAGLPEADRKRMQVITAKVTVPGLAEKFATTGTTVTVGMPSGTTAVFDASVDAALQHGLGNVAAALSNGVDLTPTPLPPNTTVTLELDVGAPVGKGLYRFTHHAPPSPPGKGAAVPAARVLIEALGKATAPPGTTAPAPAKEGEPAAPDPVAEKIKKHSFSVPYTGAELDALRAALSQIPDAHLAVVDGLAFRRASASKTDPKASGDYDWKTHTVTMYDSAFASSQARVKGSGTTASDMATRAIVHEIGHAVDLAAIRRAALDQKQADAAVAALSTKYPDPKDPTAFSYPLGGPEEKEVKAVLKAQKDAEAKVLAARSLSGTRTVRKPRSADFEDVIGTDVKGVKFREAAAKDGKAVTAYGEQDFQEAFAEAYSLYITSPETLKALRPSVFEYLDKNLPK